MPPTSTLVASLGSVAVLKNVVVYEAANEPDSEPPTFCL
jgi:hypothetical protein